MNEKIKLVAIAKDEGAYLPEWIFHHLEMGFDEIEVLVNYTSDNSLDILSKISKKHPVKYQVIDDSIIDETKDFQRSAYNMAAHKLSKGFDYLMFLDVDEFWTDSLYEHTVKDVLKKFDFPEALSFQWGIKLEANDLFSPCFSEKSKYVSSRFSKVIFKVDPFPKEVDVHKVKLNQGRYVFSNGHDVLVKNKSELGDDLFNPKSIDRYFISHRVYRSQVEYVSLLGRGRPRHNNGVDSKVSGFKLKDNRFGYKSSSDNEIEFCFGFSALYNDLYNAFIDKCGLRGDIDIAKFFVVSRYYSVIENIRGMKRVDLAIINKVLNGVESKEVKSLYHDLNIKWSEKDKISKLTDEIRDLALSFESKDVSLSLKLMKMAKVLRGKGLLINNKIEQYKKIIDN